ncbi:serine beta-lactamase-like protein LACTB, mitochondrial isoform X2 [Nelusetta ayraudi]|uniref:serine beta-lactamase-like protein LACTB, mitochondrial isoform X2 n=1 Tax=Nelusetta ayraudi TaxID=303726 RepID=UPI003F6FD7ED
MSRLFSTYGFCARSSRLAFRKSSLLSKHGAVARVNPPTAFMQQQRRCIGRSNAVLVRLWSRSRIWICGVGLGVAVAVGLKCRSDAASDLCDDNVRSDRRSERYSDAIKVSRDLVERIQAEVGAPGVVVGVSVDGAQVWSEGFGYADLENRVPCGPKTVMRIASISKPLTSAAAARLCEEGKLDLDVPVQKYVPEFPQKQFEGKDVTITPRMILSHLSGIRHYEKDVEKVREEHEKAKRLLKPPGGKKEEGKSSPSNKDKPATGQSADKKEAAETKKKQEFDNEEYYLKETFEGVLQSLNLFKDDPLIFEPGTTFLYSTHAFTLLSAVMERAAGRRFLDLMMNMFRQLGMHSTVPDENEPIVYHRCRYYHINKKKRVVNCPYVDNSYKWAGGGFLSNVGDLLIFGDALLYSYQMGQLKNTEGLLPGFLKPQTITELWAPADRTKSSWDRDEHYAQAWVVVEKLHKYGQCRKRRHYVSHTGGAVGASSVLLVLPSDEIEQHKGRSPVLPQGVVVTIITNMQAVGLTGTALKIAHEFDRVRSL